MKKIAVILFHLLIITGLTSGQTTTKRSYASFGDFYDAISKSCFTRPLAVELRDTFTSVKKIGSGVIQETFSFRLDNFDIKYVSFKDTSRFPEYYDSCYIFVNDQVVKPDSNNLFQGLAIYGAEKLVLNGAIYLILPSWAPMCNGSSCRLKYDQIFQIKNGKINYQIVDGWLSPPNIYCDLNNDGQLDQVSFMGSCADKSDPHDDSHTVPDKDYFCIQALTLKNNQWVPMTSKDNKDFFIYLQVDDFFKLDSFKVLDYYWLTDL